MKILLISLLTIANCALMEVHAQNEVDCRGKHFVYFKKTGNGIVAKCSSEEAPNPAEVTLAMPFRICVDMDLSSLPSNLYRNVCDPVDFSSKFNSALDAALAAWNSICPANIINMSRGESVCDGQIAAIDQKSDWRSMWTGNLKSATADYAEAWPGGIASDGKYRPTRININLTNELSETIPLPYLRTGHVWAFKGQCSGLIQGWSQCNKEEGGNYDKWCISMETVLLHEIGHLLGLGHPALNCTGSSETSIMAGGLNSRPDFDRKIELHDKCAIKRLYCPDDLMGVQHLSTGEAGLSLYPNPVLNTVSIQYPLTWDIQNIHIYDANGRLIYKHNQKVDVNPVNITLSTINKGVYYAVIYKSDKVVIARFIYD